MVTIKDYKTFQKENGENFFALVVQGGLEAVKSKETNRTYFTAKTATVACTFDEETCVNLIGTEMPGKIMKVDVEPYEYAIPDTTFDSIISSSSQTSVPALLLGSSKLDKTRNLTLNRIAISTDRVCKTFAPSDASSSISS